MSGLFSSPKPPKIETPKPMPDEQDPVSEDRRRRARQASLARKGRASTRLSADNESGSGPYSRTTLG